MRAQRQNKATHMPDPGGPRSSGPHIHASSRTVVTVQFAAACSPPTTTTAAASTISCSFEALRGAKRRADITQGRIRGRREDRRHSRGARLGVGGNAASHGYPYEGDRGNLTGSPTWIAGFYRAPRMANVNPVVRGRLASSTRRRLRP
jgi:hypothetical protein